MPALKRIWLDEVFPIAPLSFMSQQPVPEAIRQLERPHPALWSYYVVLALLTGPGLIFFLPFYFFRYRTLRYRFSQEGIHMRVGVLFRREVNLTYARIQDIHLRSGILQRWFGLATVQVQTASGASGPEMVIEGFKEFEAIRDYLYTRMRGYQARHRGQLTAATAEDSPETATGMPSSSSEDLVAVFREIRDELRLTRECLELSNPKPQDAAE